MDEKSEKPPEHIAIAGRCGWVRFAQVADGSYPAEEFWNNLTLGAQAGFMSLFQLITDNPNLQLVNRQKFKPVEGEMFEFKKNSVQMRIFAFRQQKTWYLICGLAGKKEDDLPPGEVRRALRLMAEAKARLDVARKGKTP